MVLGSHRVLFELYGQVEYPLLLSASHAPRREWYCAGVEEPKMSFRDYYQAVRQANNKQSLGQLVTSCCRLCSSFPSVCPSICLLPLLILLLITVCSTDGRLVQWTTARWTWSMIILSHDTSFQCVQNVCSAWLITMSPVVIPINSTACWLYEEKHKAEEGQEAAASSW